MNIDGEGENKLTRIESEKALVREQHKAIIGELHDAQQKERKVLSMHEYTFLTTQIQQLTEKLKTYERIRSENEKRQIQVSKVIFVLTLVNCQAQ